MPTGYTAAIADGISFEKFVWSCARAMNALIMMRDEPSDAPIPERFEPASFYAEKIEQARAEVSSLKSLTREQAYAESVAAFQRDLKAHDDAIAKATELRNKYNAMLAKVVQWEPPTPEHNGFKAFMLEQLHSSIKFDCDTGYYEKHPPECKTTDGWHILAIAEAERQLAYYEKAQAEEIERTESRNAWLKALRESVPQPSA
jgi:DNA repair exonuclease SbcCD ATPase subunit